MNPRPRTVVTGIGGVASTGCGVDALRAALRCAQHRFELAPYPSWSKGARRFPVGLVPLAAEPSDVPRTHRAALEAAREALGDVVPDAIVLGTTTSGIARTEDALKAESRAPADYRFHALDTVATYLAEALGVTGLVMTVSSACSSSAVAIALGRELLRCGLAGRVLAGGADTLCKLTYHGFRELQLLSPTPCAPFDAERTGLTLGEGAGFVLLEAAVDSPRRPLCELAGVGLTCDAHHPTKPRPDAAGAVRAMIDALADAGAQVSEVDYVNLHGTGTLDNDVTEALAVRKVFGERVPALSSTKGLTGHLLGGAGGIEAVVSILALDEGLLPGNVGLRTPDPALQVRPVEATTQAELRTVLSNSFGFGGNNACLAFRAARERHGAEPSAPRPLPSLRVVAMSIATASGELEATWEAFVRGRVASGRSPESTFVPHVPLAQRRRLERLSKMMVGLACAAYGRSGLDAPPDVVCTGTAWGSLADTSTYLQKLIASDERFAGPAAFVGSVHNAAAGHIAVALRATGANVTCSSGARSFEHALLAASLLGGAEPKAVVLAGADAWHAELSPLLEPLVRESDGGAALAGVLDAGTQGTRVRFLGERAGPRALEGSIARLGGREALVARYGAVLFLPAPVGEELRAERLDAARDQLDELLPVYDCRARVGEHASASAVACALGVRMVESHTRPPLDGERLERPAVLMLSFGRRVTALEVSGS